MIETSRVIFKPKFYDAMSHTYTDPHSAYLEKVINNGKTVLISTHFSLKLSTHNHWLLANQVNITFSLEPGVGAVKRSSSCDFCYNTAFPTRYLSHR